ncbi:unnamed protein product [Rhodiola kirilowii]
MEPTNKDIRRSPLGIDLNEIPPLPACSDYQALTVVRNFCYIYPAQGPPAGFPGPTVCDACSMPVDNASAPGLVCDACERGFHLACCPDMPEIDKVSLADHWTCGDCFDTRLKSKRWPLGRSGVGRTGVMLLDINALPVSDGEAEGSDDSSKLIQGDTSFAGNLVGAVTALRTNSYVQGNIIGFNKASWTKMRDIEPHFGNSSRYMKVGDMSVGSTQFGFPPGSLGSNDDSAHTQNPSETFLLALRDFISEQHGVLIEGWRAEVKSLPGKKEHYAVYYSPEGKVFESMSEVACFLGLMSERNPGITTSKKKLQSKKRKISKNSVENGCAENMKKRVVLKDASLGVHGMGPYDNGFQNNINYDPNRCENGDSDWQQFNDDLPIQYEDFFILSLGKIDTRPSYHDSCHIWPIGYKSCWHDKITGSLFICEVTEGGDEGPVFKVRRCSCSAIPIPVGSSVVCLSNLVDSVDRNEALIGTDCEDIIQQFLLDPCPPLENEISLCLSDNPCENPDYLKLDEEKSFKLPDCSSELIDEIGELSQEGHVLSVVWKLVCNKLVESVCKTYKRTGDVKGFCHHYVYNPESHLHDSDIYARKVDYDSLTKLHGSLGFSKLKSLIPLDGKVETLSDMLTKWLEKDRFGLDVQFVQEIIEQLPGISAFSDYNCLGNRKDLSAPITISDGFLTVHTKNGIIGLDGEKVDRLLKGYNKDDTQQSAAHVVEAPRQPFGKPIGTVLPPKHVGDALQVLEFLCRFHEILGLDEPLSFEEFEKELMCPWLNCSDLTDKLVKELTGGKDASLYGTGVTDHTNDLLLFPTTEHNTKDCNEDVRASIPISTQAMSDEAHAKLAPRTFKRFAGIPLTKVHCSILKLVIAELLSKVSLVVDPNTDTGEHKSKRGRKREVEGSVFSRKKLSMLPVNEFTWPEVARRYILAVIAMDGNTDSIEISNGESGKLFRCLQGDGGVLYGSLTGIAGMEGDALMLTDARKKVFGTLKREDNIIALEEEVIGPSNEGETLTLSDNDTLPDWALVLEPVRKLPTNVGTRIRNRVHEALSKGPPEWARDILQHSVSKEVYKGNASGPTKKAVISVLDRIKIHRPAIERKRQSVVSIQTSDIIANQCRIILRRAAAEDDTRMFCNLLGRKIMNSNDNDDEGLLGSPAMVSRPLDFRTIDLRLAVGAYDGSQDSFLEDVKELWNNVRTVFADQPELIVLADALFTKFDVMYEKEVIPLVERLKSIKMECSSDETKKELKDIISSTSEIPKAPWDEGVCKICGIDKDDDSVLLCDACDAEYHRYCLNPPLAKIPEGNWYCPSCLAGKAYSSASIHVVRHGNKKKQGVYNCHQLELLANLTDSMAENEYWELDVYQRMFLLKFLCDELLNTAFLRQHLEFSADISLEMQQKLRSMSNEWKNLKVKKDILMTRATKVERLSSGITEDIDRVEGSDFTAKKHERNSDVPLGDINKCISSPVVDCSKLGDELESPGINDEDKNTSVGVGDKMLTANIDLVQHISTGDVHAVPVGSAVQGHHITHIDASKDYSSLGTVSSLLPTSKHENAGKLTKPSVPEYKGKDRNKMSAHLSSPDLNNVDAIESSSHISVTEANEDDSELNAIKHEIAALQNSIMCIESQIPDQNVRREFLGCDSVLQLYWVSTRTGRPLWVIVDRSMAIQNGSKIIDPVKHKIGKLKPWKFDSGSTQVDFNKASYICGLEYNCNLSSWVSYQSDDELAQLINWLSHNPRDRELKESILHLQRLRMNQNSKAQTAVECEPALLQYPNKDSTIYPDSLGTRALSILCRKQQKLRSYFGAGNNKSSKKVGIKSVSNNEQEMHRCDCLEVVLHGRHHCSSCHRTFCSDVELAEHMDGNCFVDVIAFDNTKSITNSVSGRKGLNSEALTMDCEREMGIIECSGCPFNLKEICSKFKTNDSTKEVVKGIGLIGSNGVPSFIYIYSPYLSDPTLALVPYKLNGADFTAGDGAGSQDSHFSNGIENSTLFGGISTMRRTCPSLDFEKSLKWSKKDNNSSLNSVTFALEGSHNCEIPQSSLRPLDGDKFQLFRHLKINLLDMEAALPDDAVKASKGHIELRWAWRAFVKSMQTIFEMVQATIVLEDMIKAEHLRNSWWYWSSLTAAAKVSTLSSLAFRIYGLDAAIIYDKGSEDMNTTNNKNGNVDQTQLSDSLSSYKTKSSRRLNKRRKELES